MFKRSRGIFSIEGNLKRMFYYGGDFPKPAVNPDFLRVYGHML